MNDWSKRHKNPLCSCKSSESTNDIHSIILSCENCTPDIKFYWSTSEEQEEDD